MGGPVETVRLVEGAAAPLDGAALHRRVALLAEGRLDAPEFALARQFSAAERIVVSAPYWDLLFPASLRAYFERVCVVGVTFAYDAATGAPVSLCHARSLVYVCTAGGLLQADGLDLPGADVDSLLARAKAAWTP
jgi:FMN-dependent NADH-azoreductase